MGKFDLEKFVTSILSLEFDKNEKEKIVNWVVSQDVKTPLKIVQLAFYKALNEQRLEFEDGEIKEKALCFEEDKWYVFTHASLHYDTINGEVYFKKDKPYRCLGGETFLGDGGDYCFRGQEDMLRNLRPATEEEIEGISGNNGGISSNYEMTKFVEEILAAIQDFDINKKDGFTDIESARKHAIRILNAAKRQLQPEIDEALDQARANGKAEALKDMPKWKKNLDIKTAFGISCERYDFIEYQGLYLKVADLIEKLPKEE